MQERKSRCFAQVVRYLWTVVLVCAAVLPAVAQQHEYYDEIRYVHTDIFGSVVALTDEQGNVVERFKYEPYGKLRDQAPRNGPGFTGHVGDGATGHVYMQQRYYSPEEMRGLSVDPVTIYGSGDMRHFNRYSYAYNNPYKFVDPDGRRSVVIGGQIYIQPEDHSAPNLPGIPNNVGAQGFGPTDFSFHQYNVTTPSKLTPRQAGDGLRFNPTPGRDMPASHGGTRNNAGPIPTLGGTNVVRSFFIPSPDPTRFTDVTVNYTISGEHGLAEGFVMRFGEIGPNGTTLRSYGEGNNWHQHPALQSIWAPQVDRVWQQNHGEIIERAK